MSVSGVESLAAISFGASCASSASSADDPASFDSVSVVPATSLPAAPLTASGSALLLPDSLPAEASVPSCESLLFTALPSVPALAVALSDALASLSLVFFACSSVEPLSDVAFEDLLSDSLLCTSEDFSTCSSDFDSAFGAESLDCWLVCDSDLTSVVSVFFSGWLETCAAPSLLSSANAYVIVVAFHVISDRTIAMNTAMILPSSVLGPCIMRFSVFSNMSTTLLLLGLSKAPCSYEGALPSCLRLPLFANCPRIHAS